MGFWAWLDRTRKKPKSVRDRYAFSMAASITACVALIWGVSLSYELRHFSLQPEADSPEQEAVGAFARFWSTTKSNVASVVATTFDTASSTGAIQAADEVSTTSVQATGTPAAVIPQLRPDTIASVTATTSPQRKPRTILIGTTTASSSGGE